MSFNNAEEVSTPRGRVAPDNLSLSYLLSAGYDGKQEKAFLRLYEPKSQQVYLWYDNTGHLSYAVSKMEPVELRKNERLMNYPDFLSLEQVDKYDAIADKSIKITKVIATNPLAIGGGFGGGIRNIIGQSWESRIRYYQNYIYDRSLVPGMPYRIERGNLIEERYNLPTDIHKELKQALASEEPQFSEHIMEWARLLQCPIPELRRVAVDIEVFTPVATRLPNPDEAIEPITAVSFVSSDGIKKVVLQKGSTFKRNP
jgi:DNA polymerase I